VDCKLTVHRWDENDDEFEVPDGELFWRQSVDFMKDPLEYSVSYPSTISSCHSCEQTSPVTPASFQSLSSV
jgi:hypothetical protein